MENSKYSHQIKHIREKYKRFHIDFKKDVFNRFQEKCKSQNTTPTTVIKEYVNSYIEK